MRLVYFLCVIGLLGCNKFEHTDLSNSSCELCGYAKSLEGTYRGYNASVNPNLSDSMTAIVEQVFIGNSQIEDSTIMYFNITFVLDNTANLPYTDTFTDVLRINNSSGSNMDFEINNTIDPRAWVQTINPEKIILYTMKEHWHSFVHWNSATLYKQ